MWAPRSRASRSRAAGEQGHEPPSLGTFVLVPEAQSRAQSAGHQAASAREPAARGDADQWPAVQHHPGGGKASAGGLAACRCQGQRRVGHQLYHSSRERLGHLARPLVTDGHPLHAGEGEPRGPAADARLERAHAQGIGHHPRRQQPGRGDAECPVGHLHEAVVVLEQAAAAAEHEVAPGRCPGQGREAAQAARYRQGAEVRPGSAPARPTRR